MNTDVIGILFFQTRHMQTESGQTVTARGKILFLADAKPHFAVVLADFSRDVQNFGNGIGNEIRSGGNRRRRRGGRSEGASGGESRSQGEGQQRSRREWERRPEKPRDKEPGTAEAEGVQEGGERKPSRRRRRRPRGNRPAPGPEGNG